MDVSGLTQSEIALRKSLEYMDQSRVQTQVCEGCVQWIPAKESDRCGGCKIMKGPVHPQGHCKLFAAK